MAPAQEQAVRAELDRVSALAREASTANSTEAIRKALMATRMATINAMSVLNEVENDIRAGAQKEPA